jgi:AAA domain
MSERQMHTPDLGRNDVRNNSHAVDLSMIDGHEKVLLSALMNGTAELPVTADFFSSLLNKIIFNCVTELTNRSLLSVTDALRVSGELEKVGGAHRITQISGLPHDAANIDYALGCVVDAYRERETTRICKDHIAGKITADSLRAKLDEIQKPVEADGLTVLTLDAILTLPKDEHSCLLGDRLLAKGQSLVIAGQPGLGKSRLALQLAVACISGKPWCGIETHARGLRWLVLQTENGAERLRKDCAALKKWAGDDFDQSLLHIQVFRTDNDGFLCLSDPATVARIEATIRRVQPDGVIADPLRDFSIGDLNSDADMIATLRELSRIVRRGNPDRALVLLHHAIVGRAGIAKAFGLERGGFARNSKALLGWTRAQINVIPGAEDNNEQLVLTCGKNSNGKEFPPIAVRLDPGTMIYEPDTSFDMEGWREEVSAPGKASVKPQIFRELLKKGRDYDKRKVVELVREEKGLGKTRAYELVDQATARKILRFKKTVKTYALA